MAKYGEMYRAGREGVLEADPNAEVITGDLAPDNLEAWIKYLKTLPSAGIAIHPYGKVIDDTAKYVEESGDKPLNLSEYGNNANDPDQAAKNREALTKAYCGGTKQLIWYQLVQRRQRQLEYRCG